MSESQVQRVQFFGRIIQKELKYLLETDQSLFVSTFDRERAQLLPENSALAEKVEAFVSRFGRFQDTLAAKVLPLLLSVLAEPVGAQIDNLERAEKLGFIESVEDWLQVRKLRNKMVHEYIEDLDIFAEALNAGHLFVSKLKFTAEKILAELEKREFLTTHP